MAPQQEEGGGRRTLMLGTMCTDFLSLSIFVWKWNPKKVHFLAERFLSFILFLCSTFFPLFSFSLFRSPSSRKIPSSPDQTSSIYPEEWMEAPFFCFSSIDWNPGDERTRFCGQIRRRERLKMISDSILVHEEKFSYSCPTKKGKRRRKWWIWAYKSFLI